MPETATHKFSENAALIVLDYLISEWGMRLPRSWIENAVENWKAEANVCDQAVPLKAGGVEARWRLGMSYNMSERPADVLQRMLDACDGMIFPTPGRGITLRVGRWEEPTVTLDESSIVAFSGLTRGGDVLTRATVIRARYTSRPHKYVEQDADPWIGDEASEYGEEGPDLSFFASPSHSQTRRLMKVAYHRLNPNWRGTLVCNLGGLAVMGERFIRVVLEDYGIDETFEVQGQTAFVMAEGNVVTGVQVEVVSMSADAYAWDAVAEEGIAPFVPEDVEPEERDIPVPTGFAATIVQRQVNGQSIAFASLIANAADFGGDIVLFEVTTNGGASYATVPKDRDAVSVEYGPLEDGITYGFRAVTTSATARRGSPTSVINVTNQGVAPSAPIDFQATVVSTNVNLSARAPNDASVNRIQFRRGTTAQSFAQATILNTQFAAPNDVRQIQDTPGSGTKRYWAVTLNAQGTLSAPTSLDRTL